MNLEKYLHICSICTAIIGLNFIGGLLHLGYSQSGRGLLFLTQNFDYETMALSNSNLTSPTGSFFINPAILSSNQPSHIIINHSRWIADTRQNYLGLALRKRKQGFGIGFLSNSIGEIEHRVHPGEALGTFNVSYLAVGVGYGFQVGKIQFGSSAFYIHEEYLEEQAYGLSSSMGIIWNASSHFRLGFTLEHLGKMNKLLNEETPLPTSFNVGLDWKTFQTNINHSFRVSVKLFGRVKYYLNHLPDSNASNFKKNWEQFIGVKTSLNHTISLFWSYVFSETTRSWSSGFELIPKNRFTIGYAIALFNRSFGQAHSFSVKIGL